MEVGCGSGVIIVAVKKALGTNTFCIGTDVNRFACQTCLTCASLNHTEVEVIQTDLLTGLTDRLSNKIDLLICNPPYVQTDEHEIPDKTSASHISSSWAGGPDGMNLTRRFVSLVPDLLSPNGVFYLLLSHNDNDVDAVVKQLQDLGVRSEIRISRKCGREHLSVLTGSLSDHS